jgi:hypothetical protein
MLLTCSFETKSFDIVFSNSLIEHLPRELQQAFAAECQRVGRHFYIQTPNKWFPVELHILLPIIHWLPLRTTLVYLVVVTAAVVKAED